jgi:hypothetical protein
MRLSIKVDGELVRKGLEDLSAAIPRVSRQRIRTIINRIVRRMEKEGEKPSYPIKWDSERQRRAFFASDGFGRGIPTKRTNKYVNSWKVASINNGYRLQNSTDYAKYLGGDAYGQVHSGIHSGRWENLRDVVAAETEKLPDEIENDLIMVARRNGL